jgi:hypothetical protein
MAYLSISKGENVLIRRNLYQSDGTTPLLISTLALCKVTLKQSGAADIVYIEGTNPELREGTATNQVELEIKKAVSAAMAVGEVNAEWQFEVTDATFTVDGVNNQQFIEKILYVSD